MGKVGEGKNPTHQLKKLDDTAIREFRDRFAIPLPDDKLERSVLQSRRRIRRR